MEQVDKARYEPGNLRRQAGRREVEAQQDADQRVQYAQAAYRHSTNTAMASTSRTDSVMTNESPPFPQ